MPLTPEDVHKKTFTPVRLREGYDMGEVDQFLDVVEAELVRLNQDNDELRTRAGATSGAAPQGKLEPATLPAVRTVPEASSAAARLLEIATNNADQLVGEARDEADRILTSARTTAERLESEAQARVERLEADARTRSEKLDAETSDRRNTLFGELEQDKDALARTLEELRSYERDSRKQLKGYFETQLLILDGKADGHVALMPLGNADPPPRLRELLGEDA